jgi:two-component system response regulator
MVTKRVLVAEDNPDHARLICRAVDRSGIACEVDVVCDGTEVIDYLFGTGQFAGYPRVPPALILLDLRMPRMDGLQVLQVLRRVRSEGRKDIPPIVALTSSTLRDDVDRAYSLGVSSYVCKPADHEQFSKAIHQMLHYWLDLNEFLPERRERMLSAAREVNWGAEGG